jgi:hypothetical protein
MNSATQTDCLMCDTGILEAPRYFPRQLISSTEMTLEQQYLRDKMRRHNRFLHGWGVVCGAMVCLTPDTTNTGASLSSSATIVNPAAWKVAVSPGYILGPYGDEILIDCQRIVDLRTSGGAAACGAQPGELSDPWCTQVFVKRDTSPVYIAVKYKEMMTRPVRVQPVGCGCDDTQCEYSRWRDGYEIGILTSCPATNQNPPSLDNLTKGALGDCPDCPDSPWVVLATVSFDDQGRITAIDNCSCRRMVISFSQYWWQCTSGSIVINSVNPTQLRQNQTGQTVTVIGSNFQTGIQATLGNDVTITNLNLQDSQNLVLTVNVAQNATPGSRMLTLINPDCSVGTAQVTIVAATSQAAGGATAAQQPTAGTPTSQQPGGTPQPAPNPPPAQPTAGPAPSEAAVGASQPSAGSATTDTGEAPPPKSRRKSK